MFDISKNRILILSMPRSGSRALFEYLINSLDLRSQGFQLFSEPDYNFHGANQGRVKQEEIKKIRMENFRNCVLYSPTPFLAKIHWANLNTKYDQNVRKYLLHSNEVFRISLTRKDYIAQIKSNYIGTMRDLKWHYRKNEKFCVDKIDINKEKIQSLIINLINYYIPPFETTDFHIDLELEYESIVPVIANSVDLVKTPLPVNDKEIEDVIREMYANYINKKHSK